MQDSRFQKFVSCFYTGEVIQPEITCKRVVGVATNDFRVLTGYCNWSQDSKKIKITTI